MSTKIQIIITSLLATLMFTGTCAAGEDKIIECDGFMDWQAISAPKDVKDNLMKKAAGHQQYIIHDNDIVITGAGFKDIRINRCDTTATQYRYSYNCDIKDQQQFAMDWIQEKDINSKTSPFFKKYLPKPESIFGGKFISLDRVNLNITDEDYDLHAHQDVEKKNGKKELVIHNYVLLSKFVASCRITKPKI